MSQFQGSLHNKTNVPIYIDWNKSNLIINGQTYDDWQDKEITKNNGVSYSATNLNWFTTPYTIYNALTSTTLSSTISIKQKSKPNNQIPPQAFISMTTYNINAPFIIPNKPIKDSIIMSFDKDIFDFRNFIAYTKNQDLSSLKFINNEFWVYKSTTANLNYSNSSSTQIGVANPQPDILNSINGKNSPNSFYQLNDMQVNTQLPTQNSGALTAIIILVVVTIGAVLVISTH